jgi:hypothetical protein
MKTPLTLKSEAAAKLAALKAALLALDLSFTDVAAFATAEAILDEVNDPEGIWEETPTGSDIVEMWLDFERSEWREYRAEDIGLGLALIDGLPAA